MEPRFIAFSFQRDARKVEADNPQIVTSVVNLFPVFFIYAQEAAAAHRGLKGTGNFYYLIVVQDVRIHALAGALQRQLLDVVVGIAELVIQAVADGEYQFRKDRGLTVLAQTGNAIAQDRGLDQTRFPTGA